VKGKHLEKLFSEITLNGTQQHNLIKLTVKSESSMSISSEKTIKYANVKNWLSSIGFESYYPNFEILGYDDLEVIATGLSKLNHNLMLTTKGEDEMDSLGIKKPGHKKKLRIKIGELKLLLSKNK
jgi:hypothetical protein